MRCHPPFRSPHLLAALLVVAVGCTEDAPPPDEPDCPPGIACPVQSMDPGEPEPSFGTVPPPPSTPAQAALPLAGFRIGDQGNCGSCVAFAVRSAMGLGAIAGLGQAVDFSAAHVWVNAGYGAGDCGSGSQIGTVVDATRAQSHGIVDSTVWPYDRSHPEQSLDDRPPLQILNDRGIAYIGNVFTASAGSKDEIRYAIAQGWPVVVGVAVHRNHGWSSTGHIDVPAPDDTLRGYHAVTINSYDDQRGVFGFVNSWGTGWGDSGRGTFSYAFIESSYYHGGYAIRDVRPVAAPCPPAGPCAATGWTCQDAATSVECTADPRGCLTPTPHTCTADEACDPASGHCDCVPACAGRLCGDDGCGGSCGQCGPDYSCSAQGTCVFECPATVFDCPAAGTFCEATNTVASCSGPDTHGCFDVTLSSCDDGNACTHDSCGPGGVCLHEGSSEICNGVDDDCDGQIDEGLPGCGLELSCTSFSFNTTQGTHSYAVALPTGNLRIPLVEVRRVSSGGEDDGAWDYGYTASGTTGTFTFTTNYGSVNQTVSGRVCVLGVGATTTGSYATATVANGGSATLAPNLPANNLQVTTASLGFVPAYWSGTDDDFEYSGQAGAASMSLSASGGNSGSFVRGQFVRLSLPAGYTTRSNSFQVANGSSTTLTIPRVATRENLVMVGITTYHTCGDDDFDYSATCQDSGANTICTISAANGAACSYVAGRVTQIQWDR